MRTSILYKVYLEEIRPVIWYGQPVHSRYPQIFSVLKAKLGEDFANLLAEPVISQDALTGKEEAIWLSKTQRKCKTLSALPDSKQKTVKLKLASMLNQIYQLIETLKQDERTDHQQIGELLALAFEVPAEDFVLVEGENITLVCWGFTTRETIDSDFRLSKIIPKEEEPVKDDEEAPSGSPVEEPIKDPPPAWLNWWVIVILLVLVVLFFVIFFFRKDKDPGVLPMEKGLVIPGQSKQTTNPDDPLKRVIIEGHLNVILVEGTDPKTFMEKLTGRFPKNSIKGIGWDNNPLLPNPIIQVRVPEKDRNLWIERFKEFPEVFGVEPEFIINSNFTPNDPGLKEPENTWAFRAIKAFAAWNLQQGNENTVIAVLDSGFDLTHPELKGKIYRPCNIVNNSKNLQTNKKLMRHGTHVSATAGAQANNGTGVLGICPKCKIMPIQIADPKTGVMSTAALIKGLIYAVENGADVINLSMGSKFEYNTSVLSEDEKKKLLGLITKMTRKNEAFWNNFFKNIAKRNSIVVQAAGNENTLSGFDPMKRSAYAINVAATETNDRKASFSNYGESITVSAPGLKIYNAIPNNQYGFLNGTSMASPIVAGAVGLLKSVKPDLEFLDVKRILIETGKQLSSSQRIGPLIQLDKALARIDGKAPKIPPSQCQDKINEIEEQIKRLQQKLKQLKLRCGTHLKIPEQKTDDFSFAAGHWVSNNELTNKADNQKISLHFYFQPTGKGSLNLHEEDGTICRAKVLLKFMGKKLVIDQKEQAECENKSMAYNPYRFECVAQSNRTAECTAKNKRNNQNLIIFNLLKAD